MAEHRLKLMAVGLGFALAYAPNLAAQVPCDMDLAFWQKDKSVISGKTAVLENKERTALFSRIV